MRLEDRVALITIAEAMAAHLAEYERDNRGERSVTLSEIIRGAIQVLREVGGKTDPCLPHIGLSGSTIAYLGTMGDVASGAIPWGYVSINAFVANGVIYHGASVFAGVSPLGCIRVDHVADGVVTAQVDCSGYLMMNAILLKREAEGAPSIVHPEALKLAREILMTSGVSCQLDTVG